MPEATFFAFLFHLFLFHLFTTNVTRALPLETIKGEAGRTSPQMMTPIKTRTSLSQRTHTPPPKRPEIRSLSQKLVTPTTSTPVQGNTSSS
jgi:hypothetical protein